MTVFQKLILRIAILAMSAQIAASQVSPTASVRGSVRSAATGSPRAGVSVELQRVDGTSPQSCTTSTEADGSFQLINVRPGEYHLAAFGAGLLRTEYGQRRAGGSGVVLNLLSGQIIADIQMAMLSAGVISGRIVDLQGDPMGASEVSVLLPSFQDGKRTLKIVQSVFTNDLGEYRLFGLIPGQHFLSASASDGSTAFRSLVQRPAGLSSDRIYLPGYPGATTPAAGTINVPIYYPGTSDARLAMPIEVLSGSDRTGMDLTVAPLKTRHVRGRVPGGGINVSLVPLDSIVGIAGTTASVRDVSATEGSFDFDGVAPGQYLVVARSADSTGSVRIDVKEADMDGITISIGTGVVVSAQASIDGRAPVENDPDFYNLYFSLTPDPTIADMQEQRYHPSPDGSFEFDAMPGERYRITYVPGADAPPVFRSAYIKSIRFGTRDVLNEGLQFNGEPDAKVEIVIGIKSGSLSGSVRDENRNPAINTMVVLVPDVSRRGRADAYLMSTTDLSGRFQISQIPPGDYTVFAWDDVESGAWQNPDFLRPYESRGAAVHIGEGGKVVVSVAAIP